MCNTLILRYKCGHPRNVQRSARRRTSSRYSTSRGHFKSFCKSHHQTTLFDGSLKMSTLCPRCHFGRYMDRTISDIVRNAMDFTSHGTAAAKRVLERDKSDLEELNRMMRVMSLGGQGKRLEKMREEAKWNKREKVVGGSPLRKEVTVEELERDEEEKKRKDSGFVGWKAAKAKLSMLGIKVPDLGEVVKGESSRGGGQEGG